MMRAGQRRDGDAEGEHRAVRPLLVVVEERGHSAKEAAAAGEGCVSTAVQLTAFSTARINTDITSAVAETAL